MYIVKIFLKSLFFFILAVAIVLTLAIISIIRNPVGKHLRKLDKNYSDIFTKEKTKDEIISIKKQLDTLAKTGVCRNCNLGRTMKERREEIDKKKDNTDLLQAIKQAKDKGLKIDLSGSDLYFNSLDGVDLSGANLSKTVLTGADLREANLKGANLRGAILSSTKLQEANLQGADLTGAELGRTQLDQAHLKGANLHEAILSSTNLTEADMSNVNLTEAVIITSLTADTKFIGADFRGAKILTTFSKRADLTNAQFDGWIMRSFNTFTLWLMVQWQNIKEGIENRRQEKKV